MITLNLGIIKRVQTRSRTYSMKSVYAQLAKVNAKGVITPPATMIIHVVEHFTSDEEAIRRRQELTESLRAIKASFRFDIKRS